MKAKLKMIENVAIQEAESTKISKVREIPNTKVWKEVLSSPLPVFVDFWAEWCGDCTVVDPILDDLSKEYDCRINFVKFNVDHNPQRETFLNELPSKNFITSIPTLVMFKKGKKVDQRIGSATKESYKKMIDTVLEN